MNKELAVKAIQGKIIRLPSRPPAMLAQDVAVLYGVPTKQVNRAVKRNPARFPQPDFCFRLTEEEWNSLRFQNGTSSWGGERYAPMAFTHDGANQLAGVLKSRVADERSVQIARAFTALEQAAGGEPQALESILKGSNGLHKTLLNVPVLDNLIGAMADTLTMMGKIAARLDRLEGGQPQLGQTPLVKSQANLDTAHIKAFVAADCRLDAEAATEKQTIYNQYRNWCRAHGELPYDYSSFYKALYRLGLPVRKGERRSRRAGTVVKVVRGITVQGLEVQP